MKPNTIRKLQEAAWDYYDQHGRHDLPWRQRTADGSFDPYQILVSEIMLQQTQVGRVIPKFKQFIDTFPHTQALAQAPLAEVLSLWNGLGYNRRAKFLWEAARMIEQDFAGHFPETVEALIALPGVGRNTAGAIVAYAFNKPTIFIETNIRSVFIHHCFTHQQQVTDKQIAACVEQTLETGKIRDWYWALMDYGSFLKHSGNAARASASYVKQSPFAGSKRQLRGKVIRLVLEKARTFDELQDACHDERLDAVMTALLTEKLVEKRDTYYMPFTLS